MAFPEIQAMVTKFLEGFKQEPLTLGLKSGDGGFEFNPTDVGWYARNYPRIFSLLGGGLPAWSGESVSVTSALNHSAVFACDRIISETVAFVPADLMQQKGKDKREATEHPIYGALKYSPSDELTAQAFREMLTSHCLLGGNGYANIIRRSGTGVALELHPIPPEFVKADREKTGSRRLVYVVCEPNQPDKTYTVQPGKPHDILHLRGRGWDGLRGYSVITMGRQSIGSAIAAERHVARFWAMGGRVPYVLSMAKRFKSDEDFNKFRTDWDTTYAESNKAPILQDDMKYQQIGLSMADSQALETRLFTIPEICRWFNLSPYLAGDHSHATFSNIESLFIQFKTITLSPWFTRWEQDFRRCVLTPEEKAAGYFLKHNANALLRGDFKTRMDGYASALQNGHLNVDEVRDLEDRNPLVDGAGEDYHIQLNMQTLPTPANGAQGDQQQQGQGSLVTLRGRNGNGK